MIHLSVIVLYINDQSFPLFFYQIHHPDLYFTRWCTLSPYLPLCGVSTFQEPFGILRLIGLCGYGIRRVVTNVDKRDILPGIIISELHELIPQTIIKEAWLCIKTEI